MTFALLAWLGLGSAMAHPGGHGGANGGIRGAVGHRSEVRVTPGSLAWDYVLELPERRLYAEAREDAAAGGDPNTYLRRRLDELADGLHATLDGQDVPLARVPVDSPSRAGEAGFLDLIVHTEARLPRPTGRLSLRISNHPLDEGSYFATKVLLDGSLVVTASNLAHVVNGELRVNRNGAWARDEAMREPRLTLRHAGYLERREGLLLLEQRLEGAPGVAPAPWVFVLAVGMLAPIAWLGRHLGRRARAGRDASLAADAPAHPQDRLEDDEPGPPPA